MRSNVLAARSPAASDDKDDCQIEGQSDHAGLGKQLQVAVVYPAGVVDHAVGPKHGARLEHVLDRHLLEVPGADADHRIVLHHPPADGPERESALLLLDLALSRVSQALANLRWRVEREVDQAAARDENGDQGELGAPAAGDQDGDEQRRPEADDSPARPGEEQGAETESRRDAGRQSRAGQAPEREDRRSSEREPAYQDGREDIRVSNRRGQAVQVLEVALRTQDEAVRRCERRGGDQRREDSHRGIPRSDRRIDDHVEDAHEQEPGCVGQRCGRVRRPGAPDRHPGDEGEEKV